MNGKDFYTSGPFYDCWQQVENFGMGIYYLTCLQETVGEILKLQQEYEEALIARDDQRIAATKNELEFYENIIILATDVLQARESSPSSSYD